MAATFFTFLLFPLFGGFTQQWRKFNRKEWKQKPWGIFPESLSLFPYDWCFLSFLDTHKNQIKGHLFAVPRHNEWIDKVCEATHKRPKHIWAKKIKVNSHPPKKQNDLQKIFARLIDGEAHPVTNAISLLQACIYNSVKTGQFFTSILAP